MFQWDVSAPLCDDGGASAASDKKASNSVRGAGGAPDQAKEEIRSSEEAADPGR